jgi:hypothetical protein
MKEVTRRGGNLPGRGPKLKGAPNMKTVDDKSDRGEVRGETTENAAEMLATAVADLLTAIGKVQVIDRAELPYATSEPFDNLTELLCRIHDNVEVAAEVMARLAAEEPRPVAPVARDARGGAN